MTDGLAATLPHGALSSKDALCTRPISMAQPAAQTHRLTAAVWGRARKELGVFVSGSRSRYKEGFIQNNDELPVQNGGSAEKNRVHETRFSAEPPFAIHHCF